MKTSGTLCRLAGPLEDAAVSLKLVAFNLKWRVDILSISCEIHLNATRPHWWLVNTGSSDVLVSYGNNQLPESMLTQVYVAIS